MSIAIGEVISVKGVNIVIEVYEESNKETLFYAGEKFKGVSIREHILIRKGFNNIVALVQGEYLDERMKSDDGQQFVRKVELKPIGYYEGENFIEGINFLPMIRDLAYLMSEKQVRNIYGEPDESFVVGEILTEELPISLPWQKLFNTHIGVFGNTGSGKSNTLTNIYTTLFNNKLAEVQGKSQFLVIDFNGEYTGDQLVSEKELKTVFDLDTRTNEGSQFPIGTSEFWDDEVFGILFKATENTQKPFLQRVVSGRERFKDVVGSLTTYTRRTLSNALISSSHKKEFSELLKSIVKFTDSTDLDKKIKRLTWHAKDGHFMLDWEHLNGGENDDTYLNFFKADIDKLQVLELSEFDELRLRINLQLLADLIKGYVQFEHIQPLLKRIDASINSLKRVFVVGENPKRNLLTVISLRKCNQEVKKIIPLLLAKYYYSSHKESVFNTSPPDRTFHLIIDEAHNILSTQSSRESESWKDYRLELFEEMIKEGRKFGFYLTLSSQRPADISATIMSQLHNFFIHRLVNDRDLMLLENTISTLDTLSRSMIPNLARGCAVVTGTSFDLPMIVQFRKMALEHQPYSDDVNLSKLWTN